MNSELPFPPRQIRLPALEVSQGDRRLLYTFAIDGKILPTIASVSRLRRNAKKDIDGYQRPEVIAHVQEIRSYLESSGPMLPNAIVVAFDGRVQFEPATTAPASDVNYVRHGTLIIPQCNELGEDETPGWIVDGQQRAAAIRIARIDRFPICVTAFITDRVQDQRAQFILVNSTKPLPKGLIYELLPGTETQLSSALEKRRLPTVLLQRLNRDADSPFCGMIQTPTTAYGIIKDNSILRLLQNSLSDGALFQFRDPVTGRGDMEAMLMIVKAFWGAVKLVFPEAWGLPPRRSRLTHGAGVAALGYVMDAAVHRHPNFVSCPDDFLDDLQVLRDICHWTSGSWDFGSAQVKWSDLQNTGRDIQLLATCLLKEHRTRLSG